MESRHTKVEITLCALLAALFLALVLFQGNAADTERYGRSSLSWLAARWRESSGRFSHGWLLPVVSIGVTWWKRKELARAAKQTSRAGLAVVALALLVHVVGYRAVLPRLNLVAFLGLLWGIPFYLLGWQTARILAFPVVYLLLGIPLNFLDRLTFPLRLFASTVSANLLNGLGIGCVRSGTVIRTLAGGGFAFDVADPCSGLKYILAITALTALYAYIFKAASWKRWLLFVMSAPLAIAGNVARVLLIGIVGHIFGREAALGLYHDFSGYIVFAVVVLLMLALAAAMKVNYREKLRQWRSREPVRMSRS